MKQIKGESDIVRTFINKTGFCVKDNMGRSVLAVNADKLPDLEQKIIENTLRKAELNNYANNK